jgi:cyclopropane fatty-acyl-phospholipid synthase-like methyltransferase
MVNAPSGLLERWAAAAPNRRALVLGAGGGEEAAWLAEQEFHVDAVENDRGRSASLRRACAGMTVSVWTEGVESFDIRPAAYGLICALAVLHFVSPKDLPDLARRIVDGLIPGGLLATQVLTDADPSLEARRSRGDAEPFPNTFPFGDSWGVIHYFARGELTGLFAALRPVEHEVYRFAAADRTAGFGAGEDLVARRPARDGA